MTTALANKPADAHEFTLIDRHALQRERIAQGAKALVTMAVSDPPRRGPLPRSSKTIVPQVKPYDEALLAELRSVMKPVSEGGTGFSQSQLSKFTGISAGLLSKYMNEKPVGDVARQEAAIGDFLKTLSNPEALRGNEAEELFETPITNRIWKICDETKTQGFIGAVMGDPGIGKTCGAQLYKEGTPEEDGDRLSVFFPLSAARGGGTRDALVSAFFRNVDTRHFKGTKRAKEDWLINRFAESRRLIIMDNAHLLSTRGLEWVLGFQDETQCGFVLISNDDLKKTMRQVQRAPSRIGIFEELKTTKNGRTIFDEAVEEYLERHWPEACKEVRKAALDLVQSLGAMRSLRIAVNRAHSLLGKKNFDSPLKAFQAAVAKLPTWQRLND